MAPDSQTLGGATERTDTDIRPFQIDIPQSILDDLHQRLARARWTRISAAKDWDFGTKSAYLRELVSYWRTSYDWRRHEAELNALAQFKASVDGADLHFVHVKARGPRPMPLLLLVSTDSTRSLRRSAIPQAAAPTRTIAPMSSFPRCLDLRSLVRCDGLPRINRPGIAPN